MLILHAKKELAKWNEEGSEAVLALVKAFCAQGIHDPQKNAVLAAFERLISLKPLTPLTGSDDEWVKINDPDDPPFYQNLRWAAVFKERSGKAYYFNDKNEKVEIAFPFFVP